MLTIFAVPKPFEGHVGVIQRNAVRSWKRLGPDCQIILCGDDRGVAEAAREFQVDHVPLVERNRFGTPLLDSVFARAQEKARHPIVCYANADIIFFPDLAIAVDRVLRKTSRFLLVGQCRDLDITNEVMNEMEWQELVLRARDEGRERGLAWIDYFVFPRQSLGPLPPFAVGRPNWDNWMIWHARKMRHAVVDLSSDVTVVHQAHAYGHLHRIAAKGLPWKGPEGDANLALMGGEQWMTMVDATHRLEGGFLRRAPATLRHRVKVELILRGWTLPLYRLLVRALRFLP